MRPLRRSLGWARRRARVVLGQLVRRAARPTAVSSPTGAAKSFDTPWPGISLPPKLQATLVEEASPATRVSPRGLVAYVSHPFYGGSRRSAWQLDLVPNSALPILEQAQPDALVIDASAALWGSPWAGSGSEIDPARTRSLADLVEKAGKSGIVTVFRWDVPGHQVPVLHRIAAACDLIVSAGKRMTFEVLPVVPHGVKTAEISDVGTRIAVFSNSSPFAPELSDPQPLRRFAEREAEAIAARLLHDPPALRRLLGMCSVALFPPSSEPTLVVLETLDQGLAVVGPSGPDVPNLHESPTVLGADFLDFVEANRAAAVTETRRRLHQEHSTDAEARRIGRLAGITSLAAMGTVELSDG